MTGSLVCPECGGAHVEATLTTRTAYTYLIYPSGPLEHTSEEVDGGDLGDVDVFVCTECRAEYDSPETEWITKEAYNKQQEEEYAELSNEGL